MVCVLMIHEGLSPQAAVDRINILCKMTMDSFVSNMTRVPSWGREIDKDIERYIQGLQSWISGHLHWSFQTHRYFGSSGLNVKRELTVEISPSPLAS